MVGVGGSALVREGESRLHRLSATRKLVLVRRLTGDQSGVTGLETAIILIVFVVMASVFVFTILSTGLFSVGLGKETVYAGLNEASPILGRSGGIVGYGKLEDVISLRDDSWTVPGMSSVSSTIDSSEKKRGSASAQVTAQTAVVTGLAAHEERATAVDLTDQTQLKFWVKSSTTTVDGQFEVVLDEDTGCGSPEAHIDVPALAADVWSLVTVAITQTDGTTA